GHMLGALETEGGPSETELREILARQVELEVLRAPPDARLAIVKAWVLAGELEVQLHPLGLRSRDLVREFRAEGCTSALKARATELMDEVVRVARAAPPEGLHRARPTVGVILVNCVTVLTDGLLSIEGAGP